MGSPHSSYCTCTMRIKKILTLCRHCHLCIHRYDIVTGVSCDPNTIPTLSLTCCNVKYDVITLLTWLVARFVFIVNL